MIMVNYKMYFKAAIVYANFELNLSLHWQHPVLQHKLATRCNVDITIKMTRTSSKIKWQYMGIKYEW